MKNKSIMWIVYALMLIITIASASASVTQDDLLDGLVSYWKLENTSGTDSVGSNDFTISGATSVTGKIGNALSFDGVNDYGTQSLTKNTGDFSMGGWFYPKSSTTDSYMLHGRLGSTSNKFNLIWFPTSTTYYGFAGSVGGVTAANYVKSTSVDSINNWYHVVFTRVGNTIYLYVNGVERDSKSYTGTNDNFDTLIIGSGTPSTSFFDGDIDEVFYYSRGINSTEVTALYDIQKDGYTNGTYNFTALNSDPVEPDPTYFTITAKDIKETANINSFSVNVTYNDITTSYTTTTGTVETNIEYVVGTADLDFYGLDNKYFDLDVTSISTNTAYEASINTKPLITLKDVKDDVSIASFNLKIGEETYDGTSGNVYIPYTGSTNIDVKDINAKFLTPTITQTLAANNDYELNINTKPLLRVYDVENNLLSNYNLTINGTVYEVSGDSYYSPIGQNNLEISGATDPIEVNGEYFKSGTHNSKPSYTNGDYWLWYDGGGWVISLNKGDSYDNYVFYRNFLENEVDGKYGVVLPFDNTLLWQRELSLTIRSVVNNRNYASGLTLGGHDWFVPEDYELLGNGNTAQVGSLLYWMNEERGFTQGTTASGRNYGTWLNTNWGFINFVNFLFWSNTYSIPPDEWSVGSAWQLSTETGGVSSVGETNVRSMVAITRNVSGWEVERTGEYFEGTGTGTLIATTTLTVVDNDVFQLIFDKNDWFTKTFEESLFVNTDHNLTNVYQSIISFDATDVELNTITNFNVTINGVTKTNSEDWELITGNYDAVFSKTDWFNKTINFDVDALDVKTESFTELHQGVISFDATDIELNSITDFDVTINGVTKSSSEDWELITGNYDAVFSKTGWINETINFDVNALDIKTETFTNVYQSIISFNAIDIVGESVSDFNITIDSILKDDSESWYFLVDEFTALFEKTDWYSQNKTFNTTAATTETITLTVHDAKLTIDVKNAWSNASVSNFSGWISNEEYNYNETFSTTTGEITLPLKKDLNYTLYVESEDYAIDNTTNYATININETSQNQTMNLYSYNSIRVFIKEELNNNLITENVSILITSTEYEETFSTTNGSILIENLLDGIYNLRFSANGFTIRNYDVTVAERSTQELTAYLANNTQEVTFTVLEEGTSKLLDGARISMYRFSNNQWITVESKLTDITGKAVLTYIEGDRYKFVVSKDDYFSKTFELNPILLSTYNVRLNKRESFPDIPQVFTVSVDFTPKRFVQGENNVTFFFNSPEGRLNEYGFNITYPGGSYEFTGQNAVGETYTTSFNIVGAEFLDTVKMTYWYKLVGTDTIYRSYNLPIVDVATDLSFADMRNKDYGLSTFEKLVIVTLTILLIGGITLLLGGPVVGGAVSLLVVAWFGFLGFIPIWSLAIVMLAGITFLTSKGV